MAATVPRTRDNVIVVALAIGVFLAALDQNVVATALPTIAGEMGTLQLLPWVGAAYLLAATVVMPVAGKLGDTHGRKRVMLVALTLLVAGSAMAGFAPSMEVLIAGRAVQGLGGGSLGVVAFAAVSELAGPDRRGRYQSYFGALFGAASVAGPPIGGIFTDTASWRWIFHANVVVGVLVIVVVAALASDGPTQKRRAIDYPGIAMICGAVTCLVLLSSWAGTGTGWESPALLGLAAGTVVLAAGFVAAERRAQEPVIPLGLLRSAGVSGAAAVGFLTGMALFGAITYLPVFLQLVSGLTATMAGAIMIPFMVAVVVSSMAAGRVVDRTRRPWPIIAIGTGVAALGMALFATMGVDTAPLVTLVSGVVFGLGIGMVMQLVVLAAQDAAPADSIGTATSTVLFLRTIGSLLGVTVLGGVLNWRFGVELAGSPDLLARASDLGPEAVAALSEPQRAAAEFAFSDALSVVFTVSVPLLAAGTLVALLVGRSTAGRA